jgi:hypothetical protein
MDVMDSPSITMSVPEFGYGVYGLGRNASYEAAKRGVIPTVCVQGKVKVVWRPELRRLAGDDPAVFEAMVKDFLSKLRKRQKKAA